MGGIQLAVTSEDFRKGFMFALKCIADMGLSDEYPTKDSFVKQIKDMVEVYSLGWGR